MKKPTIFKVEFYVAQACELYDNLPPTNEEGIADAISEAVCYIDSITPINSPTVTAMEMAEMTPPTCATNTK